MRAVIFLFKSYIKKEKNWITLNFEIIMPNLTENVAFDHGNIYCRAFDEEIPYRTACPFLQGENLFNNGQDFLDTHNIFI